MLCKNAAGAPKSLDCQTSSWVPRSLALSCVLFSAFVLGTDICFCKSRMHVYMPHPRISTYLFLVSPRVFPLTHPSPKHHTTPPLPPTPSPAQPPLCHLAPAEKISAVDVINLGPTVLGSFHKPHLDIGQPGQKRPAIEAKETYYRPTTDANEIYYRGKNDMLKRQNISTTEGGKTY